MNAEILCVGTEILLGDIVNTNAAYLSRELASLGIGCYYQSVVGDNPQRLKSSLELAFSRADTVILTGGLGPTYDDLTKETVANYFGLEMEMHQPSLERVHAIMSRLGRTVPPSNDKQAMMPKGAIVFENDRGTAPGLAVEGDGKTAILLPGPPREMTAMFQRQVRPYLQGRSDTVLRSHTIHLYGIGESKVEQILHDSMLDHKNPTIAPYAKTGEVQLRVTASAPTNEEADALIRPVIDEIRGIFPKYIYGVDVGSLHNALFLALREKGMTLATAESCTGGLLGAQLTELPGASAVFLCGVVSYSNVAKAAMLGVSPDTLAAHGAVSEQTAREMAQGIRERAGADLGISVTGIAGPDGGTPEKPVGLVYVAVADREGTQVRELRLGRGYGGEREFIRSGAALAAFDLALRRVQPRPER